MSLAERIVATLAGLIGAAGVVLAAAGAHAAPGRSLDQAALIAMVHAPAILAVLAASRTGLLRPFPALLAASAFAAGVLLFSGDLTRRAFASRPLFPMAAPTGGFVLIGAWLLVAGAAASARRNGSSS